MEKQEFIFKTVANSDGSSTTLTADIYYNPSSSKPHPIALFFHSGGFVVGSKDDVSPLQIDLLLQHNFLVVAPNFRLCPTINALEGPVQDCLDCYEWARTKLPSLLPHGVEVQKDKIVALGTSCGGTLAHHMTKSPHPPHAILDIAGAKSLSHPHYTSGSLPPELTTLPSLPSTFIAQIHSEIPPPTSYSVPYGPQGFDTSRPRWAWMLSTSAKGNFYTSIVPNGNVDLLDPAALWKDYEGKWPPTCFLHGTKDTLVDVEFSKTAARELRERGVDVECILVEGKEHGFDEQVQKGEEGWEEMERAFAFLAKHVE